MRSQLNNISLLRFALAAIWTELEKDNPNQEDCQKIFYEALELTKQFAGQCKPFLSCETGLSSWKEYLEYYNLFL